MLVRQEKNKKKKAQTSEASSPKHNSNNFAGKKSQDGKGGKKGPLQENLGEHSKLEPLQHTPYHHFSRFPSSVLFPCTPYLAFPVPKVPHESKMKKKQA